MNGNEREKLEAIKDSIDDLLDNDEGEENGDVLPPGHNIFNMTFSTAAGLLRAGMGHIFHIGDEIWNTTLRVGKPMRWIVIGKDRDGEDTLTLWCPQGLPDLPFDTKREGWPYGHALWRDCRLRAWLHEDLLAGYAQKDQESIRAVKKVTLAPVTDGGEAIETVDKFWLLSACEAGFEPDKDWSEEEGAAYPYFEDEAHRMIGDWWRLRSANRGYASIAWHVNSSGNASNYGATYAYRPAPACVIG